MHLSIQDDAPYSNQKPNSPEDASDSPRLDAKARQISCPIYQKQLWHTSCYEISDRPICVCVRWPLLYKGPSVQAAIQPKNMPIAGSPETTAKPSLLELRALTKTYG